MRKIPSIMINGENAYIVLTRGVKATINSSDVKLVSNWNWSVDFQNGKVIRVSRRERIDGKFQRTPLGNQILEIKPGNIVDHKDGDRLNFRRENLRPATRSENNRNKGMLSNNTSGFKGVCFARDKRRWKTQIDIGGVTKSIGHFKDKISAAIAYDNAAIKHYGEFAKLNFPDRIKMETV